MQQLMLENGTSELRGVVFSVAWGALSLCSHCLYLSAPYCFLPHPLLATTLFVVPFPNPSKNFYSQKSDDVAEQQAILRADRTAVHTGSCAGSRLAGAHAGCLTSCSW